MKLRVLMPFSRPKLWEWYHKTLTVERSDLIWTPILTEQLAMDVTVSGSKCDPLIVQNPPIGRDPCYWKLNQAGKAIDSGLLPATDRYCLAADDTFWDQEYFSRVASHPPEVDLVMALMLTPSAPPNVADSERMRICLCDFCQFSPTGRLLADNPFDDSCWFGDGLWANKLRGKPIKVAFDNRAIVYYNLMRPEQWGFGK